jgi:hypothetical protein
MTVLLTFVLITEHSQSNSRVFEVSNVPLFTRSSIVAQMSRDELREMIEVALEQKLLELLGDPDEGLEIRESVRERLLHQQKEVAAGERGEPFEDVVRQLGLE